MRLLVDHRERLVRARVALNNTLQWHLHDLRPELRLPGSSLFYGTWGPRIARRLARAEQTMRVRIARDELRRIRELTQTIKRWKPRSPTWSPRSRHTCSPTGLRPVDRRQAWSAAVARGNARLQHRRAADSGAD